MKYLILSITFLLISCGGGNTVASDEPQVEPITFKNVPDDLSIFE